MPMRRTVLIGAAGLGWVVASTGGCEAVLGLGSQTDLPADASTGTDGTTGQESGADSGSSSGSSSGSDSGSSSGADSGSSSGADSGSGSGSDSGSSSGADSGSSSGGDGGGCTPGTQKCSGTGIETCGASGQWGASWPCSTGACNSGACTGSTTAGTSCQASGAGLNTCPGGTGSASCCTSLEVVGGTYSRTYTNSGSGPTGTADPATVSNFRLDEYEVTVGRFRQFVTAWNGGSGWTPPAGSGKHTHLNGGQGLANSGSAGTYETGWVTSDNSNIAPTNGNLA